MEMSSWGYLQMKLYLEKHSAYRDGSVGKKNLVCNWKVLNVNPKSPHKYYTWLIIYRHACNTNASNQEQVDPRSSLAGQSSCNSELQVQGEILS